MEARSAARSGRIFEAWELDEEGRLDADEEDEELKWLGAGWAGFSRSNKVAFWMMRVGIFPKFSVGEGGVVEGVAEDSEVSPDSEEEASTKSTPDDDDDGDDDEGAAEDDDDEEDGAEEEAGSVVEAEAGAGVDSSAA